MATTTKQQLLELEQQFWQAMKDEDVETAMRLTDDPCLLTGPQGVASIDKQAFKSMFKSSPYTLDDFELQKDAEFRLVGDDVAILAYNVHEDLTVDGEPVSLDAVESSTWVRKNGQWLCAAHAESIVGDPFGRDRQLVD